MYFNHSDSSTENLTLFICDKRALNVLNSMLRQFLETQYSIRLKLTKHQLIVAKAVGFSSHNDLVHSLSVEADVEDFILSFVKLVNSTSSVKCNERYLVRFIAPLQDARLTRKKLNVHKIKSKSRMPFYEGMGNAEFNRPFPVCLFLDHRTNELYISKMQKEYSPPELFFGLEETFNVSPEISAREANKILIDIRDEAEALLNESWIEWDGNNFRRESTNRGNKIRESLKNRIDEFAAR
mgnify:CR=1 FL=1